MDMERLSGVITGVVVGLLLVAVILKVTKKDGRIKCKYDERQELIRGKGFKLGFFTMLIYNGCFALYNLAIEKPVLDPFAGSFLGMVFGVAVFATYCVWNDAYFSLNTNRKKLSWCFGLIAVLNIAAGVSNLWYNKAVMEEDAYIAISGVSILCGILFLLLFILMFVKSCVDKEKSATE